MPLKAVREQRVFLNLILKSDQLFMSYRLMSNKEKVIEIFRSAEEVFTFGLDY